MMKKNLLVLMVLAISTTLPIFAQKGMKEITYRRSSLHTIMLEAGDFLNKDLVVTSYNKAPFPDKYNDHRLAVTSFDPADYGVDVVGVAVDTAAAVASEINSDSEVGKSKKDEAHTVAIEVYLKKNDIAKQLVAKWFSRQPDGNFDMHLIHERGSYDASAMQAQIAKGSIRGLASLKDAGEELIKNTFVVVNKMNFVENEPVALAVKAVALQAAESMSEPAKTLTQAAAETAYQMTKDGYSVWTVSYLYQLQWDDDIANAFYMDMWNDVNWHDDARTENFDKADIFKLKYIGNAKAKSLVLLSADKSTEEIIELATVRNVDKGYTKLQKNYDVFKIKTPIYTSNPIMAKIGMKDGVEGGDKFEVLEQVMNKDGLTEYKQVGTVKVDKNAIWDNRYSMGDPEELPAEAKLDGTLFKGSKKIQPGMLLRQIK